MKRSSQWKRWVRHAVFMGIVVVVLAGCAASSDSPVGTVEGTWAGVMQDTYFCEGGHNTIQLNITGSTIAITAGETFTTDTTGTFTRQSEQAYLVALDYAEGVVEGQFFVDGTKNYALLVIRSFPTSDFAIVGVLQKGSLTAFTCQESDLIGTWAGVAARVDANFEVTESAASTATITMPEGLALSGSDGDGTFQTTGITLAGADAGIYTSDTVTWPQAETSAYAIYALSFDKKALAVAFLTDLCVYEVLTVLPNQKFAVWVRQ